MLDQNVEKYRGLTPMKFYILVSTKELCKPTLRGSLTGLILDVFFNGY